MLWNVLKSLGTLQEVISISRSVALVISGFSFSQFILSLPETPSKHQRHKGPHLCQTEEPQFSSTCRTSAASRVTTWCLRRGSRGNAGYRAATKNKLRFREKETAKALHTSALQGRALVHTPSNTGPGKPQPTSTATKTSSHTVSLVTSLCPAGRGSATAAGAEPAATTAPP